MGPFVEAIRSRNDVYVISVTEANRETVVEDVWQWVLGVAYSADDAANIGAKMDLARKYSLDLAERVKGDPSCAACAPDNTTVFFQGDHGTYEMQVEAEGIEGRVRNCNCPFFSSG